jgi:hypothetical protein
VSGCAPDGIDAPGEPLPYHGDEPATGFHRMGDILEFPSRQAQGLAYLDRELRRLLSAKGADQPLIDFAAGQLTQSYADLAESEQYSFSVELPDTLDPADRERLYQQVSEGLEGIRRENHSLMLKLVAKLVLAEVKLFQQQRQE